MPIGSFYLLCFRNIIMYILNISSAIKKMSVNKIRDFIFDNYCKRIGFPKEYSYYSKKHQKKRSAII